MAGTIDVRYNARTRKWVAKPRFVYDAETMKNGAPSVEGSTPAIAVYNLCELLPTEMARKLKIACPERLYRSPEYEWADDKCIDVDGHCPNRYEWADRRRLYLLRKTINEAIKK